MHTLGISIILCFYNAERKLKETIGYLMKLKTNGLFEVEIIFIDNNSDDNSTDIINDLLKDFDRFAWKIIRESKIGLSHARLKGIAEARYNNLLFCDDDNWLSENYLINGMRILDNDGEIAVLGGKGIARSTIDIPAWFGEIQAYYAVGEQLPESGRLNGDNKTVYGAGMFVRKDAFLAIREKGFHFFNTGRKGKKLSSGEDTEMCLAFQIGGYKIWYDSNLEFFHFIDADKLTLKYLEKLKMGIACSRFVSRFYLDYLLGYVPDVGNFFWLKELVYSLKDLLISFFKCGEKFAIKRNFNFSKYLLQQRFAYNANVNKIIGICRALDSKF